MIHLALLLFIKLVSFLSLAQGFS